MPPRAQPLLCFWSAVGAPAPLRHSKTTPPSSGSLIPLLLPFYRAHPRHASFTRLRSFPPAQPLLDCFLFKSHPVFFLSLCATTQQQLSRAANVTSQRLGALNHLGRSLAVGPFTWHKQTVTERSIIFPRLSFFETSSLFPSRRHKRQPGAMREYPVFIPCFHKDDAAVFIYLCACACVWQCTCRAFFLRPESTLEVFFLFRDVFCEIGLVETALHLLKRFPVKYHVTALFAKHAPQRPDVESGSSVRISGYPSSALTNLLHIPYFIYISDSGPSLSNYLGRDPKFITTLPSRHAN